MTLTTHQPMRRCGKRFGTEDEAARSKLALAGEHAPVPCAYGCGGWHLERLQEAVARTLTAHGTGPDAKTRMAVYDRDGWACTCCGQSVINRPRSVGHRKRRSQGGSNGMSNLLTFLGWGNGMTGDDHHWRVDRREDPHDEARGYTVRRKDDPALIGVMYFSEHGSGVPMYLDDDGGISPDAPAGGEAA